MSPRLIYDVTSRQGRCWGGYIACNDCSDHIYQYAKFGACFQKCTKIVLSHWTYIPRQTRQPKAYLEELSFPKDAYLCRRSSTCTSVTSLQPSRWRFGYADDWTLATQSKTFSHLEIPSLTMRRAPCQALLGQININWLPGLSNIDPHSFAEPVVVVVVAAVAAVPAVPAAVAVAVAVVVVVVVVVVVMAVAVMTLKMMMRQPNVSCRPTHKLYLIIYSWTHADFNLKATFAVCYAMKLWNNNAWLIG